MPDFTVEAENMCAPGYTFSGETLTVKHLKEKYWCDLQLCVEIDIRTPAADQQGRSGSIIAETIPKMTFNTNSQRTVEVYKVGNEDGITQREPSAVSNAP